MSDKTDWKSKIDPQYLVLNRQKKEEIEKVYGKKLHEINVTEDKVEDRYCLLLLQGIRELLDLRGYESVEYRMNVCSRDYVSATCRIVFTPLYEGQPMSNRVYEITAGAHPGNTFLWYQEYLDIAACNRALCLCVRNALKINIVTNEEIGTDANKYEDKPNNKESLNPTGPAATLQRKMNERNLSFDKIKSTCIHKKMEGSNDWQNLNDIPTSQISTILELLNKKDAESRAQKELSLPA